MASGQSDDAKVLEAGRPATSEANGETPTVHLEPTEPTPLQINPKTVPACLEVCVDNLESACNAIRGGASRLELCSALAVGGLTPSVGFLQACQIMREGLNRPEVELFCLLRPRSGDFLYFTPEGQNSGAASDGPSRQQYWKLNCAALKRTITAGLDLTAEEKPDQLAAFRRQQDVCQILTELEGLVDQDIDNPPDGIVFGALTADGRVDERTCEEVLKACVQYKDNRPCQKLPVTFHRAFDMTRNPFEAMETIIKLGFHRVLTSGHKNSAAEGSGLIAELQAKYGDKIVIMPGGGVTPENVQSLIEKTRVREVHGSFREQMQSKMTYRNPNCGMGAASKNDEYSLGVTSVEKVSQMVVIVQSKVPAVTNT